MRLSRFAVSAGLFILVQICFGNLVSTAEAETSAILPDTLSSTIGAPIRLFQAQYRGNVEAEFKQAFSRNTDPIVRDQLKAERADAVKALESTYTEFNGTSDYDVSLLTGEYRHNSGDAMMRSRKGPREDFYFFNNSKLWKVLTTLSLNSDITGLKRMLNAQYGTSTALQNVGGETVTLWRIEDRIIALSDLRKEYGCYTLAHADAALWDSRRESKVEQKSALDPMIQAILNDSTDDSVSDIVDHILGEPSAGTH